MYSGYPSFVASTQFKQISCNIALTLRNSSSYSDGKWHSMNALRLADIAYLRTENNVSNQINTSACQNQVLTDLTGVFIGGIPENFLVRDEISVSDGVIQVVKRPFSGCLKNLTALMGFTIVDTFSSYLSYKQPETVDFSFEDAEYSKGEPQGSNAAVYGCPLPENLDSSVYLIGYGYLYANLKQTMPIALQSNQYFSLSIDFKTQQTTQSILFFNYDIDDDLFVLVRIIDPKSIEINLKCRIRYDDPNSNDARFANVLDLYFNRTYSWDVNLANGYWTSFNMNFDFVNRSFSLLLNGTFSNTTPILNELSVDQDVSDYELLFNFYFNVQFYVGGFNFTQISVILKTLEQPYIQKYTRDTFKPLFEKFLLLDEKLFWSGCIRNMKINTFNVLFDDLNNQIEYKNVRFDGCPKSIGLENNDFEGEKLIYQGKNTEAFDTEFNRFTEYFYRVIASNSQGESASDWMLIRTPDGKPDFKVDIGILQAVAISGYQIEIKQIRDYCVYCVNDENENVFTGIISRFELVKTEVKENPPQIYTFYCANSCSNQTLDSYPDMIMKDKYDSRLDLFYIDVQPLTSYNLTVRVCNEFECVQSEGIFSPIE